MRKEILDETIGTASEMSVSADEALQAVSGIAAEDGSTYEASALIPDTGSSLPEIVARIQTVAGIIEQFGKATSLEITPARFLQGLLESTRKTNDALKKIYSVIENGKKSHGTIKRVDSTTHTLHHKNGQATNLKSSLKTTASESEELLENLYRVTLILRPRSAYSFQAAATSLGNLFEKSEQELSTIKEKSEGIESEHRSLKSKIEEARANFEELERLKSEGASERKTVAEYLAEVTDQKARVHSIHDEAASLATAVKKYSSEFKEFQESLDKRNETFEKGKVELEQLISTFSAQKDSIESLIKRSEQMLSAATVSGLAKNFKDMTDQINGELRWSRWSFYFSITVLFISAIPLLAFVLLPMLAPFLSTLDWFDAMEANSVTTGAENGWQYFGQVLARIIILLPGAWLVSFSGARHASLFRLREHYAYKYSMAVSVEGFQKQAPDHKQEIAASILEQLAFNPTDKLTPSQSNPGSDSPTALGNLLKKIASATDQNSR